MANNLRQSSAGQNEPSDLNTFTDRVDRLERVGLAMLGVTAIAALIIGGFLPWASQSINDDEVTTRLFTLGLELFNPPPDAVGGAPLLLVLCFLFLDLVTAVTVVVLIQIVARAWRWLGFARVLTVLLILCWVGALLTTGLVSGGHNTDVHGASVLVYGAGVLLTAILLRSRALQTWWLPTPG